MEELGDTMKSAVGMVVFASASANRREGRRVYSLRSPEANFLHAAASHFGKEAESLRCVVCLAFKVFYMEAFERGQSGWPASQTSDLGDGPS